MSGVYLASTGDASPKSKKITATTGSRPVRHCSAISLLSSTAKRLIPGFRVGPWLGTSRRKMSSRLGRIRSKRAT